MLVLWAAASGINALSRWYIHSDRRLGRRRQTPRARTGQRADHRRQGRQGRRLPRRARGDQDAAAHLRHRHPGRCVRGGARPGLRADRRRVLVHAGADTAKAAVSNYLSVPFERYVAVPYDAYQNGAAARSRWPGSRSRCSPPTSRPRTCKVLGATVDAIPSKDVAFVPLPVRPITVGGPALLPAAAPAGRGDPQVLVGREGRAREPHAGDRRERSRHRPASRGPRPSCSSPPGYQVVDTKNAPSFGYEADAHPAVSWLGRERGARPRAAQGRRREEGRRRPGPRGHHRDHRQGLRAAQVRAHGKEARGAPATTRCVAAEAALDKKAEDVVILDVGAASRHHRLLRHLHRRQRPAGQGHRRRGRGAPQGRRPARPSAARASASASGSSSTSATWSSTCSSPRRVSSTGSRSCGATWSASSCPTGGRRRSAADRRRAEADGSGERDAPSDRTRLLARALVRRRAGRDRRRLGAHLHDGEGRGRPAIPSSRSWAGGSRIATRRVRRALPASAARVRPAHAARWASSAGRVPHGRVRRPDPRAPLMRRNAASRAGFITGMFVVITPVLQARRPAAAAAVADGRRRRRPRRWGSGCSPPTAPAGWSLADTLVLVGAFGFSAQLIVIVGLGRAARRRSADARASSSSAPSPAWPSPRSRAGIAAPDGHRALVRAPAHRRRGLRGRLPRPDRRAQAPLADAAWR